MTKEALWLWWLLNLVYGPSRKPTWGGDAWIESWRVISCQWGGCYFQPTWSSMDQIYLPAWNNQETTNDETMVCKTLAIKKWRAVFPERWKSKEVSPASAPAVCLAGVSKSQHREGNLGETGRLPMLKWQSWEWETKVAKVCREGDLTGDSPTQRELWRIRKYSREYKPAHMGGEGNWGQAMNHPKGQSEE